MNTKLKVLLAGRTKQAIDSLLEQVSGREDCVVDTRHIENGHADPLYGLSEIPDVLVLQIKNIHGGELEALSERPASTRPPLIVVSETGGAGAMRLAMKAGARDFMKSSHVAEQLHDSIDSIIDEFGSRSKGYGELIAVVNAKGGSGATFLACNLAHLMVEVSEKSTALVGLDMQFPTLPSYFDLKPKHGLLQALESAEELDKVALDAIMASHKSGLKVLAARPEDFRFTQDPVAEEVTRLFDLLSAQYEHVVVDVPRRLDELNAQVLSRAARIVLVVQQSLPHVQDATRLQQLLRDQLGIPPEQLLAVVNRYDKSAEIQLEDIRRALPGTEIAIVPNQYRVVAESINLGVPMWEHARGSNVTRALIALQSLLLDPDGAAQAAASVGGLAAMLQRLPRSVREKLPMNLQSGDK